MKKAELSGLVSVLLVLGLASAAAYLQLPLEAPLEARIVTKVIPGLAILSWVLLARNRNRFAGWVALGLAFAVSGDAVLELHDSVVLFNVGVALNLGALVSYIVGFTLGSPRWKPWRFVPPAVYFLGNYLVLFPKLGDSRVSVLLYSLAYMVFLWRAWARLGDNALPLKSRWTGFWGGIGIALCDTLLGFTIYITPFPLDRVAIMAAWWVGLFLLAWAARTGREA